MEGKDELFQGTAGCKSEAVAVNSKCKCSNEEENQAHSQESKENNLPIRNKFVEKIYGTVDCGSKPSTIIGCHKEPTQEKKANMLHSILSLVHDSQCNNNCYFSQCRKMKIIVLHTKECKLVICPICKRVNDWSDYHSKDCQGTKCPMSFCLHKYFEQIKCDNVQVGVEFPLVISNSGPSTSSLLLRTSDAMVGPDNDSNDTMIIHSTIDGFAGGEQRQVNAEGSSRKAAIMKCVRFLEHGSKCTDANCHLSFCPKAKMIVSHVRTCTRKGNGRCAGCFNFVALNCYHSKDCQETKCSVPYCKNIKKALNRHQLAQNQILERRIATMQNCDMTETIRQSSPGSSNQPSPDDKPLTLPHGPQPGIGLTPSACSPVATLQAAAARQTVPHMVGPGNFDNNTMVNHPTVNPALMHAQQQQQWMQNPMPQMLPGQQNQLMGMRNTSIWDNSIFNQNMQLQGASQPDQLMGLRPPSQMMGANNMSNLADPAPELSQVMSNPGTSAWNNPDYLLLHPTLLYLSASRKSANTSRWPAGLQE